MTRATREALEHVSRILHDAGWDDPPIGADRLGEPHRQFLVRVVTDGIPVEEAGRAMGLAPDQTRALFLEAVDRLRGLTPAGP